MFQENMQVIDKVGINARWSVRRFFYLGMLTIGAQGHTRLKTG